MEIMPFRRVHFSHFSSIMAFYIIRNYCVVVPLPSERGNVVVVYDVAKLKVPKGIATGGEGVAGGRRDVLNIICG